MNHQPAIFLAILITLFIAASEPMIETETAMGMTEVMDQEFMRGLEMVRGTGEEAPVMTEYERQQKAVCSLARLQGMHRLAVTIHTHEGMAGLAEKANTLADELAGEIYAHMGFRMDKTWGTA